MPNVELTRDDITTDCTTCHGNGRAFNEKTHEYDLTCHYCSGCGFQPTEFGEAILELVKTWGGK